MNIVEWTSQYSKSGVMGEAEKAAAKGSLAFEEASKKLILSRNTTRWRSKTREQSGIRRRRFPLSYPPRNGGTIAVTRSSSMR